MRNLHLSIVQELARFETQQELEEAIGEILDLLEVITEWRLLAREGDNLDIAETKESPRVNPFEGRILWSS